MLQPFHVDILNRAAQLRMQQFETPSQKHKRLNLQIRILEKEVAILDKEIQRSNPFHAAGRRRLDRPAQSALLLRIRRRGTDILP